MDKRKKVCANCKWWGSKSNAIVSATVKDAQVCCNPIAEKGVFVTHATDKCGEWAAPEAHND